MVEVDGLWWWTGLGVEEGKEGGKGYGKERRETYGGQDGERGENARREYEGGARVT